MRSNARPVFELTIPAGASASNARETGGNSRGSFQCPAALTGTTLTMQVSYDGVTWSSCPVEGNETAAVTFGAGANFSWPVKAFSFRYMRLLSNGTEAAARTFPLFGRD